MSEAECAAARNEWNQNAGEAVPMVVIEDHKCPFQVVCVLEKSNIEKQILNVFIGINKFILIKKIIFFFTLNKLSNHKQSDQHIQVL